MSDELTFPKRPDYGTQGIPIEVAANMFEITKYPYEFLHHYDVTITPPSSAARNREVFEALEEIHRAVEFGGNAFVFDGRKNAYTRRRLPRDSYTLDVQVSWVDVQVKIEFASDVDLFQLVNFVQDEINYTPHDAISALEIIFRHGPSKLYKTVGRSFYSDEEADMRRYLNFEEVKRVERHLKGLRVETTHRHPPRSYRVCNLTTKSANETFFKLQSGEALSVATFFERVYGRLDFPMLPCVEVGKGIFLPFEKCQLKKGQRQTTRLTDKQKSEVISHTTKPPHIRKQLVAEASRKLEGSRAEVALNFELEVDRNFAVVPARVLPPPQVNYNPASKNAQVTPVMGVWNMADKRVSNGARLSRWAVLALVSPHQSRHINRFITDLMDVCNSCGLQVSAHPQFIFDCDRIGNIENALRDAKRHDRELQLILVILNDGDSDTYGEVKRVDSILGVPSQCVLRKNVVNKRISNVNFLANLVLKINPKLGGTNLTLSSYIPFIKEAPTIVFGADVTHPGTNEHPSYAAVVASTDVELSRYASVELVQPPNQEIIDKMSEAVELLLMQFYKVTKQKPQRLLFFRDGVSDGQFAEVKRTELRGIQQACQRLDTFYKPRITFVVVKKRHHVRCFPLNKRDSDKSGNCQPGTVIDKVICHPNQFDFFLYSHSGIQGTSRPTHYHVIEDENNFTADSLQSLAYNMCYTYARCTRSVSLVPPAYYAHLAASRAKARGAVIGSEAVVEDTMSWM
eukprot:GHVN01094534.1.p1 GENE.GHVN01094534.1~~GHVN01094534.1.p1  ORF type:complete len:742 (-),score=97.64 GHVN01094534.1:734-2959(-)